MKLKWTLVADIELLRLVTYVHPRNRGAARKLHERTRQKVRQLERFPFSGRIGSMDGTRELVVGNTPYVVVYTIDDETIVVHHVFHSARKWPPSDDPLPS